MAVVPIGRDELIVDLFHRRGSTLLGLARTLVDSREEAEEVVQEAFERLVASFVRIDDSGRADRYLTVTVLNIARSRLRRRRTVRAKDHLLRPNEAVTDDGVWIDDDVRRVRAAIQSLPRRQQQCVVLRYYSGHSEKEIADALGISAGSVKQHLSRARSALAESLGGLT